MRSGRATASSPATSRCWPLISRRSNGFSRGIPTASTGIGRTAYPRYKGAEGVERWVSGLVERTGVLLLPASIYLSQLTPTPTDRFRIGYGRAHLDVGLAALEADLRPPRAARGSDRK
jgi:hypothetical protein